jgi:hypothetical protein
VPLAEARRELLRDVAADALKLLDLHLVPARPPLGEVGGVQVVAALEFLAVLVRAVDALGQVREKAALEPFVRELLEEDRREPDRQRRPGLVQRDLADHVEQR